MLQEVSSREYLSTFSRLGKIVFKSSGEEVRLKDILVLTVMLQARDKLGDDRSMFMRGSTEDVILMFSRTRENMNYLFFRSQRIQSSILDRNFCAIDAFANTWSQN